MVFEARIREQFHFFRVDQDELDLRRVLLYSSDINTTLMPTEFTLARGACDEQVRHFGQVGHEHLVLDGLAECDWQIHLARLNRSSFSISRMPTVWRFLVRHLDPDGALARHRGDDPDAQGGEAERDIVLQVFNFGNMRIPLAG